MKKLVKLGIVHRLILQIVVLFMIYMFLKIYDYQNIELYRKILFFSFLGVILIFWLPTEIRILLGKVVIARTVRFDKTLLIFLIPATLEILKAFTLPDLEDSWNGVDKYYFSAVIFICAMFLTRNKYYLISQKFIKYKDFSPRKIKIKDITEIKKNGNEIQIVSDKTSLVISPKDILDYDRNAFIEKINSINNEMLGATNIIDFGEEVAEV